MIKVIFGNNARGIDKDNFVIVDENTIIRDVLNDNGIDYSRGNMHLNGSTIRGEELDKSFADFNITDKCYLLNIAKADNA